MSDKKSALRKGWLDMQKNGMWLPILASVGVGAATYYTMTKNNQNFNQTIEKMVPLVTQMSGSSKIQDGENTEQLGPYGMS
jgi:CHASE3 domain sensor protein